MTAHSKLPREERLLQLSEEVNRIAGTLARLSTEPAAQPADQSTPQPQRPLSPRTISSIIQARRLRSHYFSEELFADPAWDIMLELLRSELLHVRVNVSALAVAAAVPPTTAIRWITSMVEQGLIIRRPDPHDARRVFVTLAPEVSLALHKYFAEVEATAGI